jgi:hypothetical protein
VDRRDLLKTAAVGTGAMALDAVGLTRGIGVAHAAPDSPAAAGQTSASTRLSTGYRLRLESAARAYSTRFPSHPTNGEEADYPGYVGMYSKGLPHDDLGEVDPAAYRALLQAVQAGRAADFEAIPMGTSPIRPQLGPQGGLAYDLMGPDTHRFVVPPPPRIDGAWGAAEMAEIYWMALLHDVKFAEFETNPLVAEACADLSTFAEYKGPKVDGRVTPATLFRGETPADLVGPLVSQFLLRDVQYGTTRIAHRHDTVATGVEYMTDWAEYLAVQRGAPRATQRDFANTRYLQTPRDVGHYVHFDQLYQPYLYALLIVLGTPGYPAQSQDPGNPYLRSRNQVGFPTYGGPHIYSLLSDVAVRAIKHTEFQQFFVHRRLRPEAVGGLLEVHLTRDPGRYDGVLAPELVEAAVVDRAQSRWGTALLPQAFPEGSPMSPSYQSGHSTVAGACVTVLKAWLNESFVLPNPVVPDDAGTALVPYTGPGADALTIGGELNKLAFNIGLGRAMGGVHYRTDNSAALALGESIAIEVMRDQKPTFPERASLSLTRFDGTTITI